MRLWGCAAAKGQPPPGAKLLLCCITTSYFAHAIITMGARICEGYMLVSAYDGCELSRSIDKTTPLVCPSLGTSARAVSEKTTASLAMQLCSLLHSARVCFAPLTTPGLRGKKKEARGRESPARSGARHGLIARSLACLPRPNETGASSLLIPSRTHTLTRTSVQFSQCRL